MEIAHLLHISVVSTCGESFGLPSGPLKVPFGVLMGAQDKLRRTMTGRFPPPGTRQTGDRNRLRQGFGSKQPKNEPTSVRVQDNFRLRLSRSSRPAHGFQSFGILSI